LDRFSFNRNDLVTPRKAIPSVKTNLLELNPEEDILVWFGHSSYFLQIDKKKVLIDPVFRTAVHSNFENGGKAY